MPLFEYKCIDCGYKTEKISKTPEPFGVPCAVCGGVSEHVPSVTGYRTDHTINGRDG